MKHTDELYENLTKALNIMQAKLQDSSTTDDAFEFVVSLVEIHKLAEKVKANVEEMIKRTSNFEEIR